MSKLVNQSGATYTELLTMRTVRENTLSKWDSLGFLDGLKGHVKENIAQLYESEASHLLDEPEDNIWYVYMVECSDGTIYTGISNNVSKRLKTHNNGKGAKYTKTRLPVVLKWLEACNDRSDASKVEHKIKKLTRKQKLKLINNNNMVKLTSLEESNSINRKQYENKYAPVPNGISCPDCGEELVDSRPGVRLLSSPPKTNTACTSCDYKGYRVV